MMTKEPAQPSHSVWKYVIPQWHLTASGRKGWFHTVHLLGTFSSPLKHTVESIYLTSAGCVGCENNLQLPCSW